MVLQIVEWLAIWFAASLVLGIFIGRLIAAHERSSTPWAPNARKPTSRRTAA